MAPAASVLATIGDHDVLFGQRARLLVGLRDDEIARERPLRDGLRAARRSAVGEKLLLAAQEPRQIRRGPGIQLSASVAARRSVMSPHPPIHTSGCGFVTGLGS